MSTPLAKVYLVGRPNVGKSSLFNALLGYRRAIVLDLPGTTHDFLGEKVEWDEKPFELFDSQGVFGEENVVELTQALSQADICLFVVDGHQGLSPYDEWMAKQLLASAIPTLLLINKSDRKDVDQYEFAKLGFEHFMLVSAAHRRNLEEVKEWCLERIEAGAINRRVDLTLSFVGRPNAGKSTLTNRLAHENVSKVSPIAHTTRDPVSVDFEMDEKWIRIVDTAGIRRHVNRKDEIEIFSVHAAKRSIRKSDVVLLLLNASEPLAEQDIRLINLISDEGKPAVVLYNFWDKLKGDQRAAFEEEVSHHPLIKRSRTQPISALTGENVRKAIRVAFEVAQGSESRIPTGELNRVVKELVRRNPPPAVGTGAFNILYASQVSLKPATFVFFMNKKDGLPKSYERYLDNGLRKKFDFNGLPIRLLFRGSEVKDRRLE